MAFCKHRIAICGCAYPGLTSFLAAPLARGLLSVWRGDSPRSAEGPPHSILEARLKTFHFGLSLPALMLSLLLALAADRAAAGPAVLTLNRDDQTVRLGLDELEALPQHRVTTANEFVDRPVTYRGPLARDVLALLGLNQVEVVRFKALNDYYIDVPTSELRRYDVILALEADGRRLSRRDKGPLWLMYPISDFPELADPLYNARLIWQVVSAEAK
jgi:hypothetical protein